MRRLILLTATAIALAACQSAPKDYVQFHAGMDSTTIGETDRQQHRRLLVRREAEGFRGIFLRAGERGSPPTAS